MFKINWLYSFFLSVLFLQINASPKHLVPLQNISIKILQRDQNLSLAMSLAQSRRLSSEAQIEKDKKVLQKAKRYIRKNKFKNAYNILKGKKFNKLKKYINRLKKTKQNKQKTSKKRQLLKLIDSEIYKFSNLSTNSLEVQSQPVLVEEAIPQAPIEEPGQFQMPRLTENGTERRNQRLSEELKHAIGLYKMPDILREDGFANTLNVAMSNSNVCQKFITQIISYVFGKEIEEEKALYLANAFSQSPNLDIAADAMVEFLIYFLQDLDSISWERIPISVKGKLLKNIYQVDSRIILFMRDFLGKLQGQIIQNQIAERTVLTKKELQKLKPYIKAALIGLDSWKEYQQIVAMALLADAIEKTGSLGSVDRKPVILQYMHKAIPGLRVTNNPLQILFRKLAELYYHKTKSLYINADYARHKGYFGSNSQIKIIEPLVQDVIDCYFLRECEDGKSSQHALAVSQTSSSHFSVISGDIGIAPRADNHFMTNKQDISDNPLNINKIFNKWFFDSFFRYLGLSTPSGNERTQYIDLVRQSLGDVYYKILMSPGFVPYIKNAHIINYSWGSELKASDFQSLYSFTKNINHILHIQRNPLKPLEFWWYIHEKAINEINSHLNKAIHVLAAGNASSNLSTSTNSKGIAVSLQSAILATNPLIETVILVGASGYEDRETFASFSNYPGSEELIQKRFLTAPGSDVLVPYLDTEQEKVVTAHKSGTSFSAPMVTGAAALLVEAYGKTLLRRYVSLYNDEIFARTLNENPAKDFVFVPERLKIPGQTSIEDYDKALALVFKKLTSGLTVDEQSQLDHITAPNLIKNISISETTLQNFQKMRSRFIVACLLDGARKVDLFTGQPLDPSYFGQGVLDIKSSLKLLESKFERIENLLTYHPEPINIQEYKALLGRLSQRIGPWIEATYNLQ